MHESNPHARLEAFADGVFAIAITLLVIELKPPHVSDIGSIAELWGALQHMLPSIFAFVLSFIVILITWVNHHTAMKLVDKTSHTFIYANGFMLFTVAIMPFPTALLGEYLLTDYAAPAVVLYAGVDALQALAWIFFGSTALKARPVPLTRSDVAHRKLTDSYNKAYQGFALYSACAVAAFWFPKTAATIITVTWLVWLWVGIRMRKED